jgi:hypothetical protein
LGARRRLIWKLGEGKRKGTGPSPQSPFYSSNIDHSNQLASKAKDSLEKKEGLDGFVQED